MRPQIKTGRQFWLEWLATDGLSGDELEGAMKGMGGALDHLNRHAVLHLHADTRVILYGDKQLGFAPSATEAEDEIYVIAGMSCPFLLRK